MSPAEPSPPEEDDESRQVKAPPLAPRKGARAPRGRMHVILLEPQYAGNVGHVARSMMNFGLTDLHLVNPVPMDAEGRDRAVHAQRVLNEAKVYDSFEACAENFDYLVGFTGVVSELNKAHRRNPVSLPAFAPRIREVGGDVGLVFGREDYGLSNEDLLLCDVALFIPTSPMYESMNLSHAVTVALYELGKLGGTPTATAASFVEKRTLFRYFGHLTKVLGLPAYRQRLTVEAFMRVIGRAGISKWEYHRLMGIISRSLKAQSKWPKPADLPDLPEIDPEAVEALADAEQAAETGEREDPSPR